MKTKTTLSLSRALIKENYKMYWYLPVLSFIAYFLAGVFPLIMNPRYLTEADHWYLEGCLQNYNAAFVCLLIAAPLVGAIVMMHFLHSPTYAMAIHAQPFSRSKIFCSQVFTGWSMCVLPPAVMTLIYLVIAGQPEHALHFGASSLSIITFFYGIFILAGVLVGTAVMHVLLCGILFGIVPLVIWLTWMYCDYFLTGFYNMPDWMEDFLFDTNPILHMIEESGDWFTPGRLIIYLAIGLAFLLLSALLYSRAKLERVGDSMTFRAAEEIITWLVVFVGMSAFGFFFYGVMDEKIAAVIGMVIGTLLTFVVVKIVIQRTIGIASRQNLLSLGVFALIAVIFAGCTMYNLTGFTQRVPKAEEVASISRINLSYSDTFSYWYDYIEEDVLEGQDTLTSPEAIEKVVALHQYIVDHELYDYTIADDSVAVYDSNGSEVYQGNSWMTFRYTLENGRTTSRRFDFRLTREAADLINEIVTDQEYKDDGALPEIFVPENISGIDISVYDYSYEYEEKYQNGEISDAELDYVYRTAQAKVVLTNPEEVREFLDAMNRDHYSRTYTVLEDGSVSLTESQTVSSMAEPNSAVHVYNPMDYMNINGTISLMPGTEGVETEWYGTPPESGAKPIGAASFSVHSGHEETLRFLEEKLRQQGDIRHADHIAQNLNQ